MNKEEKQKWIDEAFSFLEANRKTISRELQQAENKVFWIFGRKKVKRLEEELQRAKLAIKNLDKGEAEPTVTIIKELLARSNRPTLRPSLPFVVPPISRPPILRLLSNSRHEVALRKILEAISP